MKKLVFCLLAVVTITAHSNAQVKKAPVKSAGTSAPAKSVMKNLNDSFSYAVGVNIADNMKQQGITSINSALLAKAVDDVFNNKQAAMSPEQCQSKLQQQMGIYTKMKEDEKKKFSAAEKAKGEAFLANNKKRKEVTTLPDGMQYEILTAGDPAGIKPTEQDTVVVDYIGTFVDGKQFDASTGRGPATFALNQVIKGWTEILQLMTKNAHWKVYIPSELAYGDAGRGESMPGGATLIFEITLHDVKPATTK